MKTSTTNDIYGAWGKVYEAEKAGIQAGLKKVKSFLAAKITILALAFFMTIAGAYAEDQEDIVKRNQLNSKAYAKDATMADIDAALNASKKRLDALNAEMQASTKQLEAETNAIRTEMVRKAMVMAENQARQHDKEIQTEAAELNKAKDALTARNRTVANKAELAIMESGGSYEKGKIAYARNLIETVRTQMTPVTHLGTIKGYIFPDAKGVYFMIGGTNVTVDEFEKWLDNFNENDISQVKDLIAFEYTFTYWPLFDANIAKTNAEIKAAKQKLLDDIETRKKAKIEISKQ